MKRSLFLLAVLGALLPTAASCQPPALVAIWGSTGDRPGQFIHPTGLALDPSGNLYVADLVNHRIQVLTSSGVFVTQWGSTGLDPWSITGPQGIATDFYGHLFIAEWMVHVPELQTGLQVFTTTGVYIANWGTSSYVPAPGVFNSPFGVAVGPDGHVYVTDTGLARIQVFTNDGTYLTQWSVKGGDVAVDGSNNVFVATGGGVWKFSTSGTPLTSWGSAGTGPGEFNSPCGVAVDATGNVYVADTENNRIQVFTGDGAFVTAWGSYGSEPGQLYRPMGIAVGSDGRVFVADTYNNRIQVFGSLPVPTKSTSWGRIKALYR